MCRVGVVCYKLLTFFNFVGGIESTRGALKVAWLSTGHLLQSKMLGVAFLE